jgi:predicted Zn-dependent peptidase
LYAGTSPENLKETLERITTETKAFFETSLTDERLEFFKNQLIGQLMISSDDVENRMHSIGTNEQLLGKYRGVETVIEEVSHISQKDLREFFDSGLDFAKSSLVVVGDLEVDRSKIESLMKTQIEKLRQ